MNYIKLLFIYIYGSCPNGNLLGSEGFLAAALSKTATDRQTV